MILWKLSQFSGGPGKTSYFFHIDDGTPSLLLCSMEKTQQKPVIVLHTNGNGAFLAASTEEQRLPVKDSNTQNAEGTKSLTCRNCQGRIQHSKCWLNTVSLPLLNRWNVTENRLLVSTRGNIRVFIAARGGTTWTGDFKCREVKTGFCRKRWMQTGSSGTLIGWKSGQTTFVPLWDRMEGAWLWSVDSANRGLLRKDSSTQSAEVPKSLSCSA